MRRVEWGALMLVRCLICKVYVVLVYPGSGTVEWDIHTAVAMNYIAILN